jgi:hypothetical protein
MIFSKISENIYLDVREFGEQGTAAHHQLISEYELVVHFSLRLRTRPNLCFVEIRKASRNIIDHGVVIIPLSFMVYLIVTLHQLVDQKFLQFWMIEKEEAIVVAEVQEFWLL